MRVTAVTAFLFGLVIACAGWLGFTSTGSRMSLAAGLIASVLLVLLAGLSLRRVWAGYLAGVVTFFLSIYFAYRMIVTERLVPSGVLLVVSFLALFGTLLGVFLSLRPQGPAAQEGQQSPIPMSARPRAVRRPH